MKLIQNSKFKIQNFLTPICLFLFLTIIACSSTTEVSKGSLTGFVNLEGLEDHSGIIVALYNLAYLDTTIVRINNQYPQIGVHINQHTEFDHRLQSTIKSTETLTDGSFEITKIPTGTYNLVAMKAGYGFKYLYEININEGENTLTPYPSPRGRGDVPLGKGESKGVYSSVISTNMEKSPISHDDSGELNRLSEGLSQRHSTTVSGIALNPERRGKSLSRSDADITLYPETHISGDISNDIIVAPDHHLIIDDDTDFVPNTSSLTIHPGAVIRINPGVDLTIHGNLLAQGEENNMFWITSNHGFEVRGEERREKGKDISHSLTREIPKDNFTGFTFPISREDILLYNSLELSSIASVSDDLIEWGKCDYANTCLLNQVNNLHMQDGIFRNGNCGFKSTGVDSTFCENLIGTNCMGDGSVSFDFIKNGKINNNIYIDSNAGIDLKNDEGIMIFNNFFKNNQNGIYISAFYGEISNNEFINSNIYDIFSNGGAVDNPCSFEIKSNIFNSINTIKFFAIWNQNYVYYDYVNIFSNNFYSSDILIQYWSECFNSTIDINMNYLVNAITEEDYISRIIDEHEVWENLLIRDILLIPNVGIGINEGE